VRDVSDPQAAVAAHACVAAVLAGGGSRRMGRDKAAIPWRGAPLVHAVVGALRQVTPHVVLVGAPHAYGTGAPIVADAVPGQRGPLAGLCAVLAVTHRPVVLVGCDMPFIEPALVRLLLHHARGASCTFIRREGRLEPLGAVYTTAVRPLAVAALANGSGRLTDLALHYRARILVPAQLGEAARVDRFFTNLNRPDDVERWRAHAEAPPRKLLHGC